MLLYGLAAVEFSPAQLAVIIVMAVLLVALTVVNLLFIVWLRGHMERRLSGELQEERERLMEQLEGMKSGVLPAAGEEEEPTPPQPHKLQDSASQRKRELLLEKMDLMKESDKAARKREESQE